MSRVTVVFRWNGAYWGFIDDSRLYDRYGRHAGWIEPGGDVYRRGGGFMGEVVDHHYVLRNRLRGEPVHRASRPAIPHGFPPGPLPDRAPRDHRHEWSDALPWPIPPPTLPTI